MTEIDYDELRKIHRFEKNSTKLFDVEPDFFASLKEFVSQEKKNYLESLKDISFAKARDFTNMKKIVEEIFDIREKKMLNRALLKARGSDVDVDDLANEEKQAFDKITVFLSEHRQILNELFSEKQAKKGEKSKVLNKVSVRILKDVQAFIGTDMKEYGPFKLGEKIELPVKTADLLVSRKLAEK